MRKVFSSFLVLLLLLSSIPFINTAMADELPSISIKLKNYIGNQNQVNITIKGEYDITGSDFSLVEGKTYTVKVENSILSLYENGTLLSKFTSFTAVPKEYGTNNYISINNRPYLGMMKFDLENNTYIRPTNTLLLEDYLKGVVPFEMVASWNKEALKAQAVAARTYAVRYKTLNMDDTISYQAYGGYTWYSNSSSAVDETTSQTLMYNGKLIDAFYSASNGGKTESNANVWGGTPLDFFPIKEDPYDTKVPWSFTLKKTQIDTTSLDLANPQNWWNSINETDTSLVSNIKSWMYLNGYANNEIKVTSIPTLSFSDNKTTGGRVKLASINLQFFLKDKTTGRFVMDDQNKLKTNTITYTDTSASKVRAMIGINVIKSYLVTNYQDNGTSYSVSGLGNGHGVGMSQWGAKVMADQGVGYRGILSFYYPGTTLTNTDSVPAATSTVPATTTTPVTATTTAPDTVTTTVTVPVSTTVAAAAPATNVMSPPIISNVSSFYTASAHQIAIDYVLKENVTTTVYVKDSKGTIIGYPIKNRNQIPGKQRITFDVAKVPNGNYTFGITITNTNTLSASAIKNVTVNKLLQAPKITSVSNKDTAVSGTAEAKASITIKVGTKVIATGSADAAGKYKLTIAKLTAGTKLAVTAKDGAGNVSSAGTTVLDKIAPVAPKVNSVIYTDIAVTGTTEANATVAIKVGTKVIGNGKADTKGKFRVSIPKQRTGTTLLITAKDSVGNVSTAAALKVKIRR